MSTRLIEERHGVAGARGALEGAGARARMSRRLIEERHGVAGARGALWGVGGHVGAPHIDR